MLERTIIEALGRVTSTFNRHVVGSNPTSTKWWNSSAVEQHVPFRHISSMIFTQTNNW
ncbi:hypothetical protein [Paenibacillus sp. Soil766]|uniref:hypothetical protein n=1 Tax=Paenibacillus sp. Soil766 TaxID=1736404 RepID=UPI0012F8DE4F|nr:hypothetical protein [Paenibacillus sp. Soil766]